MLVKQHEDLRGRAALDRKSARDQLQGYVESLIEAQRPHDPLAAGLAAAHILHERGIDSRPRIAPSQLRLIGE